LLREVDTEEVEYAAFEFELLFERKELIYLFNMDFFYGYSSGPSFDLIAEGV